MIFIWTTLQTPLKMYKQPLHFEIKSKYFRLKGVSNLQRGKTNSSTINEISYQNETSYSPKNERTEQNVRKVLGLKWNIQNDNLLFAFENFVSQANSVRFTKKSILKIGAMFFDLLLILSPITLQPKPFFTALCENISNWDDEKPVFSNLFCQ